MTDKALLASRHRLQDLVTRKAAIEAEITALAAEREAATAAAGKAIAGGATSEAATATLGVLNAKAGALVSALGALEHATADATEAHRREQGKAAQERATAIDEQLASLDCECGQLLQAAYEATVKRASLSMEIKALSDRFRASVRPRADWAVSLAHGALDNYIQATDPEHHAGLGQQREASANALMAAAVARVNEIGNPLPPAPDPDRWTLGKYRGAKDENGRPKLPENMTVEEFAGFVRQQGRDWEAANGLPLTPDDNVMPLRFPEPTREQRIAKAKHAIFGV